VISYRLQREHRLIHALEYGSRTGRSAIDAMMITISKAERARAKGKRATLLRKDVVSVFDRVRREKLVAILTKGSCFSLAAYSQAFLGPRRFGISWGGVGSFQASMGEGTTQGSPRSPVLWLIYLADTLRSADRHRAIHMGPGPLQTRA